MKRRNFFTTGVKGVLGVSMLPLFGELNAQNSSILKAGIEEGTSANGAFKGAAIRKKSMDFDVAVIGAGMAGISAAVAAARTGSKTVLVQDRPVLGGNASSEMRVTVNGVQGLKNAHQVERETGIIEEILIENWHYNPQASYPVWDHVLYNYVVREKNITLLMNTQAIEAVMDGNKIKSAICWQSNTETEITINAKMFVDCSGDGLLAANAGAEFRMGREGKEEFGEIYAPDKPDGWVMGDCIMMITQDMGVPTPFYAPDYAIPFDGEKAQKDKHRKIKQIKEGFWWVEVGSEVDIIGEREEIRHKLMAYFYGVWDYIKNSGKFPEAANIALDWVGAIPGRRESRRFMGDHILTETDLTGYKHFSDAVAYGGWSLDEHCPGGIENLDEPASYFHANFNKPYEIPFRSLYSKNISNLLLAGRNVSVSHIALSSTRIISTCALMGQAVGTASTLCVQKGVLPRELGDKYINELQEQLLRDDVYIPNRPAVDTKDLARKADLIFASSTKSGDAKLLVDGVSRDEVDIIHHWQSEGLNSEVQLEWKTPVQISQVEVKLDTNLQRKINMHKNPEKHLTQILALPPELTKKFTVEGRVKGKWVQVASIDNNKTRLAKVKFDKINVTAIRLKFVETYGDPNVKVFEVRCFA